MPRVDVPPARNRLLAALPGKDYRKLLPLLEPVELAFAQVLYEPHAPIRHVYFPCDCMVSLMTGVGTERYTEVGMLGSEGMLGVPAALGMPVSHFLAVVQGNGTALRMKTPNLRTALGRSPALLRELLRFSHLLTTQVAQTAACNRFHVVTQRLARWLLMTRDRVRSDKFRITQEFLSRMLGVRRVGVSEAAGKLQERGLIDYSRGTLTIRNLNGLTAASCGCYGTVRDIYTHAQKGPVF